MIFDAHKDLLNFFNRTEQQVEARLRWRFKTDLAETVIDVDWLEVVVIILVHHLLGETESFGTNGARFVRIIKKIRVVVSKLLNLIVNGQIVIEVLYFDADGFMKLLLVVKISWGSLIKPFALLLLLIEQIGLVFINDVLICITFKCFHLANDLICTFHVPALLREDLHIIFVSAFSFFLPIVISVTASTSRLLQVAASTF